MISFVEALNFRSLRDVQQEVGRFQTLVGPNGSGKSTFLDVPAFMGDLLRAGPYKAIAGEGTTVATRAADPSHMFWMREGVRFELAIELAIPPEIADKVSVGRYQHARYEVAVQSRGPGDEVRLGAETLWLIPEGSPARARSVCAAFPKTRFARSSVLVDRDKKIAQKWLAVVRKDPESGTDFYARGSSQRVFLPFRIGPTKAALANLPEDEEAFPVAIWVKRVLMEGIQRIALDADALRRPSPSRSANRFLSNGSNLPWVIETLRETNYERFEQWIEHVRTALPDLKTIVTVEREEDRHRYLVVEYDNGLRAPSWVVSDGTLRLLALTLLAYAAEPDSIYLIEEPENGIHPRAVETVYQSLSAVYDAQVFCASHSPVVLGLAKPDELLCFAKDAEGATDIVRGSEHPRLRDWKGALDLGTLFAAGVLG